MPISVTQQNSVWKKVLSIVEKKLTKDKHFYDTFFANTKLIQMNSDELVVLTNSVLCKSYLSQQNNHTLMLNSAIKEVTGKIYRLCFVLEDELEKKRNNRSISFEESDNSRHYFSNCKLNPKYTFDSFVVGNCNREAVRASLLVCNNPGVSFNPLFIYSKSGLGKTHLLHAIGNYYQEKNPNARVLYITTDAFIDEFVKYVNGSQDNQSLRDFFKTVDLLLVDDIQFLSDKTKTAEMFFYIFNSLVNNGKQIVLTSDRHPNDLRGLEERLVSRFNMGLSVNIQHPDTETLLEILKRKISSHGLVVNNYDEDGLLFLAETFSKNVRELEGALNRVLFYTVSLSGNEKVTLETIKETVEVMMPTSRKKDTTEEDIIKAVAKYYNLSYEQIVSNVRTAQIALSRRIAMYLCRLILGSSYLKIGAAFSRDHSTVITGVEKVEKELKTNTQLVTAIDEIKKSINK